MAKKRIGLIGFLHESNTFISELTTYEHFNSDYLLEGDAFIERMSGTHHETAGFISRLEAAAEEFEIVPLLFARAMPYGTICASAYEKITSRIIELLKAALPLDGLLLAPHGATVSQDYRDADGHWMSLVRDVVGSDIPIVATLDPHGNLSKKMATACNALVAYRSNPHLDQFQVGVEAANLLIDTLHGDIQPTMAVATPAIAINIQKQESTAPPCLPLYQQADSQLAVEGVLSNSIMLGFPYADVAEMGSAFIVVTNNDVDLAERCATELADFLDTYREGFKADLEPLETTLEKSAQLEGPICLLDMGDNTGGGSPADSTILLHACDKIGLHNMFVCIYDPAVVVQASEYGIGDILSVSIGAKTDDDHGEPWCGDVKLMGLYDGKFHEPQPRHGGATHCDQGATAVLRHESGITIMVTTRRQPPFSLKQLTTFDVDPADFHILIAKGVNAPIAAYETVCKHLLRVNTAGSTTADMDQLNYQHRRRPMFPFEDSTDR